MRTGLVMEAILALRLFSGQSFEVVAIIGLKLITKERLSGDSSAIC